MNKRFFFLSGLPRSGSTCLGAILSQNQKLYVSGTSGIQSILVNIMTHWNDVAEFNALDPEVSKTRKLSVMRAALEGFYADVPQEIVIDKCRGWPQHFEMAESVLGYKPKAIITVRDVRDVLASFERIWRERKAQGLPVDYEKGNQADYQSVAGRCKVLINGLVGTSANAISDAALRGWKSQMHFVEYDELCSSPKKTLDGIYQFLEIEPVEHNFAEVKTSVFENDTPYGWGDLHTIRSVVAPHESQWQKYLPTPVAMQYSEDAFFWRKL